MDRAIVTRLLSRSGRILAGISSNMGITLLVEREKGVLRGRARTEEEAKEANRVLKLKVRVEVESCWRLGQTEDTCRKMGPPPRVTAWSVSLAVAIYGNNNKRCPALNIVPSTACTYHAHTRTHSLARHVSLTARASPLPSPIQVAALSQRRSEQANASGANASAPKARAVNPGMSLSSAHSKRTPGGQFAEGGPGPELTDAFEELQAFFEGGTLSEGPTPTTSTKVCAASRLSGRKSGGGSEARVIFSDELEATQPRGPRCAVVLWLLAASTASNQLTAEVCPPGKCLLCALERARIWFPCLRTTRSGPPVNEYLATFGSAKYGVHRC